MTLAGGRNETKGADPNDVKANEGQRLSRNVVPVSPFRDIPDDCDTLLGVYSGTEWPPD